MTGARPLSSVRARLRRLLPVLVVCVVTAVAFLPALEAGFVNWDDPENFLKNERYRGLGWARLRWMFTTTLMGHYIPLTWLSLGVNHALGGMAPWGYHLGNLLLHVANAGVFYFVARRLLAAGFTVEPERVVWGAALAALVFGAHPLRPESVAWVTERRDVLCGLFYLLAVLAYLRGAAAGDGLGGRWRTLSLLAFVAALLSKAMAMTLPATLLLLDWYPLGRGRLGWRRLVREKASYALVAAAGAGVALWAVRAGASVTSYGEQGVEARVAMVGYSLWFYPWKMLWPVGLSPLYELPERITLGEWRFLGPVLATAVVTALLLLARRRWPAGLAAWGHSIIVLLPVSGIVHAGYQLAHDRYSYLSGLGFALLAGAGLTWVGRRGKEGRVSPGVRAVVGGAAVLAVLGLAWGTWQQSRIWRDSESLWEVAVAVDPRCVLCRNNLGHAFLAEGRYREAEVEFRAAIALRPGRAHTHNNLGTALAYQGRYPEAEREFGAAMRLSPGFPDAAANQGALRARQGRYAEAIPLLRHALALAAEAPGARVNLAHALKNHGADLARQGRLEEALGEFAEAVALSQDDADTYLNMGRVLVELGRAREALPALERAVSLVPRDGAARFWLARALLAAGRPAEAERHAAVLREVDPALAASLATGERAFPTTRPPSPKTPD